MDPEAVEFALWAIDQNPAIAERLGISVRAPKDNVAAGDYNPAAEIIRLFKGTQATDTAVHEILHHTERMMPADMQEAIRREWAAALAKAMRNATPEQAAALENVIPAMAGDKAAYKALVKAIQEGPLNYEDHYQLTNPSEFWAVNATKLMADRFAARDSVWKRIATWMRETVQKARALVGLRSSAPLIRALDAVLEGDGSRLSKDMLSAKGPAGGNFQDIAATLGERLNDAKSIKLPAGYIVGDLFNNAGKVSWWHKTVGTMHNLAERSPPFKRVYDSAQKFLNDVSSYAAEAADLAPKILPKMESWRDLAKSPLSAEDTKALSAPVFEGTLVWTRDASGKPVRVKDVEAQAAGMDTEAKARQMLREGKVTEAELKRWQALPVDSYDGAVRNRFESAYLRGGIVWTDAELKSQFGLTPQQIGLYREFRAATDKSLNDLATSDMIRFAGKDGEVVRQQMLDAPSADAAAMILRDHLYGLAEQNPDRAEVLNDTASKIVEKADRVKDLIAKGYAPLSRFGNYFVSVKRGDEQVFFSLYESKLAAAGAARRMRAEYPDAQVSNGTMPQEAFKMFSGVSPETLELFGEMLGLEEGADGASNQAFQQYLKVAKNNRSAMKRLIERKGIAGFSEDAGRVLAGFIYSNARQTSQNLNAREMSDSLLAIKENERTEGELFDTASKLLEYIRNPQEEAGAFRGLLFAQYLGGNIASAMVNATQPLMVTFPYLSQFGGVAKAGAQMKRAVQDALAKTTGSAELDAALKKAEADGIVSPQEVHHLMAQAAGKAQLQAGDGTLTGNAAAAAGNALSKLSLAWGKVFSVAEQYNRRVTFIAAYRTAVDQGIADPFAFAERTVTETQFNYTKAGRPRWARGAVGSTLFTFKTYSVSYVELLHRMYTRGGPEGKRATLLALAMLFLVGGVDGLPGADDLDDVVDGLLQRLGYNFSTKQAKREFLVGVLGEDGAQFVSKGISGLPGAPIDVSGRMGLGNLIPGTGFLTKKQDYTRDAMELAGPAADFAKRAGQSAAALVDGEPVKAVMNMAPTAARNLQKAYDMSTTGMYRDDRGRKVIDTDGTEALFKAIGFQPNSVAKVQEATATVQQLVGLNKMMEAEISQKWAQGMFEKDQDKVQEARTMLRDWNTANPSSPINITSMQILKRVR
ncbi:MAG: PLxRFG domain-containing protein, partial [Aquincola sp.]|nr:PLxRFG domain-containing protein [Aquincola sp.]